MTRIGTPLPGGKWRRVEQMVNYKKRRHDATMNLEMLPSGRKADDKWAVDRIAHVVAHVEVFAKANGRAAPLLQDADVRAIKDIVTSICALMIREEWSVATKDIGSAIFWAAYFCQRVGRLRMPEWTFDDLEAAALWGLETLMNRLAIECNRNGEEYEYMMGDAEGDDEKVTMTRKRMSDKGVSLGRPYEKKTKMVFLSYALEKLQYPPVDMEIDAKVQPPKVSSSPMANAKRGAGKKSIYGGADKNSSCVTEGRAKTSTLIVKHQMEHRNINLKNFLPKATEATPSSASANDDDDNWWL